MATSFQTIFQEQGISQQHSICDVVRRWRSALFFLKTFQNFWGDMIDALFFYLNLLYIQNFLCGPTYEKNNRYALISFCHVCHQYVGESASTDVFCDIVSKPHSDLLSININLLFLDCGEHNGAHLCCITRLLYLLPNDLNLLPGFNTTKPNQRRPLPNHEFLPPNFGISCNSTVHFHCSVCTSQKKAFGL